MSRLCQRAQCVQRIWVKLPTPKVKKKGKYFKTAMYAMLYGASVTRSAKSSKLGLRRTNVLSRLIIAKRKELL